MRDTDRRDKIDVYESDPTLLIWLYGIVKAAIRSCRQIMDIERNGRDELAQKIADFRELCNCGHCPGDVNFSCEDLALIYDHWPENKTLIGHLLEEAARELGYPEKGKGSQRQNVQKWMPTDKGREPKPMKRMGFKMVGVALIRSGFDVRSLSITRDWPWPDENKVSRVTTPLPLTDPPNKAIGPANTLESQVDEWKSVWQRLHQHLRERPSPKSVAMGYCTSQDDRFFVRDRLRDLHNSLLPRARVALYMTLVNEATSQFLERGIGRPILEESPYDWSRFPALDSLEIIDNASSPGMLSNYQRRALMDAEEIKVLVTANHIGDLLIFQHLVDKGYPLNLDFTLFDTSDFSIPTSRSQSTRWGRPDVVAMVVTDSHIVSPGNSAPIGGYEPFNWGSGIRNHIAGPGRIDLKDSKFEKPPKQFFLDTRDKSSSRHLHEFYRRCNMIPLPPKEHMELPDRLERNLGKFDGAATIEWSIFTPLYEFNGMATDLTSRYGFPTRSFPVVHYISDEFRDRGRDVQMFFRLVNETKIRFHAEAEKLHHGINGSNTLLTAAWSLVDNEDYWLGVKEWARISDQAA